MQLFLFFRRRLHASVMPALTNLLSEEEGTALCDQYNPRSGRDLERALITGYRTMAEINLSLSIEDEETLTDWIKYEESLSEDEKIGGA